MRTSQRLSLGLIGFPLDHSLSPQLHNAAMAAIGRAGAYRLYPIPPGHEGEFELKRLLNRVRMGEIHGLNVTIPHKQNVLPFLDRLTPAAEKIGAVNTIYLQEGLLTGDNTDAAGFLADLKRLGWLSAGVSGKAVVLGAGGAARAVTYTLLDQGWETWIAARQWQQAEDLARHFEAGMEVQVHATQLTPQALTALPAFQLLVNATSAGMTPQEGVNPWSEEVPLPAECRVYDLVYRPPETRLLRFARNYGLAVENGLGMLIEQAALSFATWTKEPAPRTAMRRAVQRLFEIEQKR